jgi:endogenous inhibitor of DNA gyrase (YacG/DUF329 family)
MAKLCLICNKKEAVPEFKPFCSKRCSDIDLGRWLNGAYVIEGEDGGALDAANDLGPDAHRIPPETNN